MKRLNARQRITLGFSTGVAIPFVLSGLCCGCGTLMDNNAPPVAKQMLQGVDILGTGVIAVATSPVWVPMAIGYDRQMRKQNAEGGRYPQPKTAGEPPKKAMPNHD